jgi:hypothetical protein
MSSLESLELQRNVLHLSKLLPQSRDIALQFASLTKLSLSNNALPQLQASTRTVVQSYFACVRIAAS